MIRRAFRRGLTLGLLGGAIATAVRAVQGRRATQPAPAAPPAWDPMPDATPVVVPEPVVDVEVAPGPAPQPDREPEPVNVLQEAPAPPPAPPAKKAPAKKAPAKKAAKKAESKPAAPWVEPTNGECPGTHPVKGKLASKIFHVPGGFNYPRTKPDRCYLDAAAAEADGLRPSKR